MTRGYDGEKDGGSKREKYRFYSGGQNRLKTDIMRRMCKSWKVQIPKR
jgi:hypothetical protein